MGSRQDCVECAVPASGAFFPRVAVAECRRRRYPAGFLPMPAPCAYGPATLLVIRAVLLRYLTQRAKVRAEILCELPRGVPIARKESAYTRAAPEGALLGY